MRESVLYNVLLPPPSRLDAPVGAAAVSSTSCLLANTSVQSLRGRAEVDVVTDVAVVVVVAEEPLTRLNDDRRDGKTISVCFLVSAPIDAAAQIVQLKKSNLSPASSLAEQKVLSDTRFLSRKCLQDTCNLTSKSQKYQNFQMEPLLIGKVDFHQ